MLQEMNIAKTHLLYLISIIAYISIRNFSNLKLKLYELTLKVCYMYINTYITYYFVCQFLDIKTKLKHVITHIL